MYLIFENPGKLDERALFILGVNAKASTDAIGYFGTGLKYAVAVAARHNWPMRIQPGDGSDNSIGIDGTEFRGKDFAVPMYRGKHLPITLEFGKHWKPWMVYRELHSNALDEGGRTYASDELPEPQTGTIRFILQSEELLALHAEPDLYFWRPKDPEKLGEFVTREERHGGRIYYRGIFVGELDYNSNYSYNITSQMPLTEDRTYSSRLYIDTALERMLESTKDEEIIEEYLTADSDLYEGRCLTVRYTDEESTAYKVAARLYENTPMRMTKDARNWFRSLVKKDIEPRLLTLTSQDKAAIESVRAAFTRLDLSFDAMDWRWKAELEDDKLGLASLGARKAWIGRRAFEEGLGCLIGTCLEEYCHAFIGHDDNTRAMQDWLLRQTVNQLLRNQNAPA